MPADAQVQEQAHARAQVQTNAGGEAKVNVGALEPWDGRVMLRAVCFWGANAGRRWPAHDRSFADGDRSSLGLFKSALVLGRFKGLRFAPPALRAAPAAPLTRPPTRERGAA